MKGKLYDKNYISLHRVDFSLFKHIWNYDADFLLYFENISSIAGVQKSATIFRFAASRKFRLAGIDRTKSNVIMSNPHDHSDSGSEYIDPEEENEYGRPNRWKGAPSTWQTLTAQERALAASLDQIRNADLSVHLYNAHALKQRAQILSANPDVAITLPQS